MTIFPKYQNKLLSSSAIFGLIALAFFLFVFPFQKNMINNSLLKLLETKKQVQELRQEQKNVQLAKEDLAEISQRTLQPEDFFSRDTTLVREIANIEKITEDLDLDATLAVSGTAKNGLRVEESKDLLGIPYSINLSGRYQDLVKFMEYMENSANLVSMRSVSLNVASGNLVSASIAGAFYIKSN